MKPKPWVGDEGWFDEYSKRIVILKNLNSSSVPKTKEAIKSAFMRVYRAVAFDIDGTLTEKDKSAIDLRMAGLVGRLLQRGVPVFLITGRGRKSARQAADEIRTGAQLSNWYFRKLYCITHNGVFLLSTPSEDPTAFLRDCEPIAPKEIDNIDELVINIREIVKFNKLGPPDVVVSPEPQSVRIIFNSSEIRNRLENKLRGFVVKLRKSGHKFYLSRGSYAESSCLDLSGTNKKLAINHIGQLIGVPQNKILRIGDQGQERGNDFDLLDSSAGFSVRELSITPTRCYPVLDDNLRAQIYGADATEHLLNLIFLFSPLSIIPTNLKKRLIDHSSFEQLAIKRSREEAETVTHRLRLRLKYLINGSDDTFSLHNIDIADIYDRPSGGVKFRDWEFNKLPLTHPARQLFEIPSLEPCATRPPCSDWSMYTDTGILMRGPNYYFGLTQARNNNILNLYHLKAQQFISDASSTIDHLSEDTPDLTKYKIALAIQDNIRNILLNILSIAFMIESEIPSDSYTLTNHIFKEMVTPHTREHFDFLLNPDADWFLSLISYKKLIYRINKLLAPNEISLNVKIEKIGGVEELFKRIYKEENVNKIIGVTKIFRWRECDHFLQNITAIQLGLHELRQRPEIQALDKLIVVGIAYGGIELPSIAATVAEKRGFSLGSALTKVSIYSDRENSRKVRAGDHEYVTDLLYKTKPICLFDDKTVGEDKSGFVLMDDNCTTGVTLQLTRDFLVTQGADVVGAVVVRFPGVNRYIQMAMPGHGFPDPEVLFSFIRGLVAPSPYARLIYQRWKGKDRYLDQTKMFDKAKRRIIRYLEKNGVFSTQGG